MKNNPRILVAALGLSAAGFIGLVHHEGYTEKAVIPTENDRPTIGYGSTYWENGTPVKMGEKITPVRALVVASAHINKEENAFRKSLPGVKLTQGEYDIYMDWVYQYGSTAWAKSSMRMNLLKGDYVASCTSMLKYKYSGGYDCSIPGNRICSGVWKRQQERVQKCLSEQ